jgi:hypothetical protein
MKTQIEQFVKDVEAMRLFQQERVILEATSEICDAMEEQGITRSQLAERLGKSKGYVSQLLDGRQNMTLRTLADVFLALGLAVHVQPGSLQASVSAPVTYCVDHGRLDKYVAWGAARHSPYSGHEVQMDERVAA